MAYAESRLRRFVVVGLIVTVIDLGLTYLVMLLTGGRLLAVTLGFIAGLASGFLLHASISFSVSLDPIRQLPRYLALVGLNYLETILIVMAATGLFDLSTIAGKLISLPIVAATSYLISKHWVYRYPPNCAP